MSEHPFEVVSELCGSSVIDAHLMFVACDGASVVDDIMDWKPVLGQRALRSAAKQRIRRIGSTASISKEGARRPQLIMRRRRPIIVQFELLTNRRINLDYISR